MANQPKPDMQHLVLWQGEAGELQKERYIKFHHRGLTSTRFVDNNCLQELGLQPHMEGLLNKAGLSFISTMNTPNYKALTLEFLSSYAYHTRDDADAHLTGSAQFWMFNREYTLNHEILSDIFHFPRGNNMQYRIPPELDWNGSAYAIWERITGEPNVTP